MPRLDDPFLPQDTVPGAPPAAPSDDAQPLAPVSTAPGSEGVTDIDQEQLRRQVEDYDRILGTPDQTQVADARGLFGGGVRPPASGPAAGQDQLPDPGATVHPGDRFIIDQFRRPRFERRRPVQEQTPTQDPAVPDVPQSTQDPDQAVRDYERALDPNTANARNVGLGGSIWNAFTEQFLRMAGADIPRGVQIITGRQEGIEASTANAVDRWMAENLQINPEFRDHLLVSTIAPAVGAIGGFVSSIFLTGGIGAVANLTTRGVVTAPSVIARAGIVGTLTGRNTTQFAARVGGVTTAFSGSGAEQYRDALAAGASWEDTLAASRINGVVSGALDAIPVFRAFHEVDARTGNMVQRAIARAIGNGGYRILETGASEMFTEAAQTVISNLIASDVVSYDPSRGMFENVIQSGAGGFTAGALLQTILNMLPGGRRVHFRDGGTGGGSGGPAPMTPIGPVPFDLLRITDQTTRTEWNAPRTGIEGHEETYFALPPRQDRSEFLRQQQTRIRDIDAAWKRDRPEYVGDPTVGASLGFYEYLLRSEADLDKLRAMSPERASQPDVQARMAEIQANREVIDILMDPVRMVNRPMWVLQRPGKGKKAGETVYLAVGADGKPIHRTGKRQRVVGVDGADHFVGNAQIMQIDNVHPENIVLSPQGQHLLRLARMRMEAEQQAMADKVRAEAQVVEDATSAEARTDRRKAGNAPQITSAGTRALPPPQGKTFGEGFVAYEDSAPASAEAIAQTQRPASPQGELFSPPSTFSNNAARPDNNPSGVKHEPLKPPPLTEAEQLELEGLTQTSGEQREASLRASELGAAAMATLTPRRVELDSLPPKMREKLDKRAVQLGIKLPEVFSEQDLVKAGVPKAEARRLFKRVDDVFRLDGAAKVAKEIRDGKPPLRGVNGIMEFYKDLPLRERRAIRKVLKHFQRHVGPQMSELDVVDFAEWLKGVGEKDDGSTSAQFLYGRHRELADGIRRASIALRSEEANSPTLAKATRNIAHELTHFLIGLTKQTETDMEQLWQKLSMEMSNDPTYQEIVRLYANDPDTNHPAIMAEEFLAFKVEAALAGRYETTFEKMGPNEEPSLRSYFREFIRRIYEFIADTMDVILGRNIIMTVLGDTAAQFGVNLDTYTVDTSELYNPYEGPTNATQKEVFAKKRSMDAGLPQVRNAVADYYAIRFRGPKAYKNFTRYMEREFGETWTDLDAKERRNTWDAAVQRMSGYKIDNAYINGVLSGAPQNPKSITELLGMAKKGEGPNGEGRFWYQLSAEEVLKRFRDNADRFLRYLAVTSLGQNVAANTTQAISAMAQASIRPEFAIGPVPELDIMNVGYPESTKAANQIKATGEWSSTFTKSQNFYRAMAKHLGFTDDATGVIDRWMMRALGYDNDSPSDTQYAHARLMLESAARALGWHVDEVQAAIWVAIKQESAHKASRDASNYADAIKNNERVFNFEIAPSNNLAVGQTFAALSYADRERITARIIAEVMPGLARTIGVDVFNPMFDVTHGGYLSTINPSVSTVVPLPDWAANATAAAMGYVFRQDAILITRVNGPQSDVASPTKYVAMRFNGIDKIPAELAQSFWDHAMRVEPALNGGYATQGNQIVFFNLTKENFADLQRDTYSKLDNHEFHAALRKAATTFTGHNDIGVAVTAGTGDARLISNDWSTDANGESYRRELERVRPGFADQLDASRALTDAILAEEFEALDIRFERAGDENTVGREIAPSVPMAGSVDIWDGGERTRASSDELAGRTDDGADLAGIDPGTYAQQQIYSRGGVLQGGVDTTPTLKIYNLDPIIVDKGVLSTWLTPFKVNIKYFSFESIPELGVEEVIPRVAVDGYHKGTVWLYDPRVAAGSFKDIEYTRAWRVTHELGHGITEGLMQEKYGPSRRYGRMGRPMQAPRGKGEKKVMIDLQPLSLREAQRAVEWEDVAFRAQRMLLQDLGITITDEQFAQEYNVNISDALYRVITGSFGDPGEYGFVPATKPVNLAEALQMLEQVEFRVAQAQGRDPTRGAPLATSWEPVTDEQIANMIQQAKTNGLSSVAVNPKDDYPGEFFERENPGESAELTSPLAYTNLYAAVLGTSMKAGKASEWRAVLRREKVPLDELRWSGLLDWMAKRKGLISREMIQTYVHAADLVVEGGTAGELVFRSNPFDRERTVVKIAYAPRTDVNGKTLLAVQGVQTNQTEARTSLAVRRAIRWAAEEGFDGITWVPSEALQTRTDSKWTGNVFTSKLPHGVTFKATLDDTGVGFIETINIPASERGSGAGRSIVNEFEQAVAERNGSRVDGEALPNSVGFWRKMGYTVSTEMSEDGTFEISKTLTPQGTKVSGPLVSVEDTAHALAESFGSDVTDTRVVIPDTKSETNRTGSVQAKVLNFNEAISDSVDDDTSEIYFKRRRANPMPGYQPSPNTGRNWGSFWSRMINWYQGVDALFTQSSKRIRMLGRTKSAYEIGNHFRRDPWTYVAPKQKGVIDEDYHSVIKGILGGSKASLRRLAQKMSTMTPEAIAEIPNVLRGGNVNPATGRVQLNHISLADARWMRQYMEDVLNFTNEHAQGHSPWGPGKGSQYVTQADLIHKIPNYFPQVWQLDGKFPDGPFRGLDKSAIAHEFFKGLGFYTQHQQQDAKIEAMINHIRGENGFVSYAATNTFRPGTVTKFSTGERNRVLKIDPNAKVRVTVGGVTSEVTLNDLLNNNTQDVLMRYAIGMARHAEFHRRFGPKGEELTRLINNMNSERRAAGMAPLTGEKLDSFIYQIHANMHALPPTSEKWAKRQAMIKMVTNANLLFFTTVASIPEVMMPGVRLGLRGQMTALGAGLSQVFSSLTRQGDTTARRIAKDLGVIRDHFQSSILDMATNQGHFTMTRWNIDPNKVTDKMFRITALTQWTHLGETMAVAAGLRALPHWAESANAGSEKYKRFLREVGLVPADLAGFNPNTYIVGTNTKIDAALRQIASEIIIAPQPGALPGWHQDPRLKLVSHIKAFMTGFGNTVLQRPIRELANGNLMPIIWLAAYAALAASTAKLWEWLMWGSAGNPSWRRAGLHDSPGTQFMLSTISRGGLTGPYQMFVDIVAMNRTAQGGSAASGWVPSANIADRLQNLASGLARLTISGFDNPQALRTVVNSATLLTPGLSAAGGWREGLVNAIAPQMRNGRPVSPAGQGGARTSQQRW